MPKKLRMTRLTPIATTIGTLLALGCGGGEGDAPAEGVASKQPAAVAEARRIAKSGDAQRGAPSAAKGAATKAGASAEPATDGEPRDPGGPESPPEQAATEDGGVQAPQAAQDHEAAKPEKRDSRRGTAPSAKRAAARRKPQKARTVTATVVGKEFQFNPSTITAPPGAKVRVTFNNGGTITHNITFTTLGHRTDTIAPDKSDTLVFTAPSKPGSYPFVCKVVGHAAAGMKGNLVVK